MEGIWKAILRHNGAIYDLTDISAKAIIPVKCDPKFVKIETILLGIGGEWTKDGDNYQSNGILLSVIRTDDVLQYIIDITKNNDAVIYYKNKCYKGHALDELNKVDDAISEHSGPKTFKIIKPLLPTDVPPLPLPVDIIIPEKTKCGSLIEKIEHVEKTNDIIIDVLKKMSAQLSAINSLMSALSKDVYELKGGK